MDQGSGLSEKMRYEYSGNERISGALSAGAFYDSPAKRNAVQKKEALLSSIEELKGCVDYIDWKQDFYDDVLSGKRPYISNLIPAE